MFMPNLMVWVIRLFFEVSSRRYKNFPIRPRIPTTYMYMYSSCALAHMPKNFQQDTWRNSKFQIFKILKFQNFKISNFQNFKIAKANNCKNGKGGPWANDVYRITNPIKAPQPKGE